MRARVWLRETEERAAIPLQKQQSFQAHLSRRGPEACSLFLRTRLALGLSASQLFNLLLGFAASAGALGLGSGLLACGALQLLSFQLVFNFGGVGHV